MRIPHLLCAYSTMFTVLGFFLYFIKLNTAAIPFNTTIIDNTSEFLSINTAHTHNISILDKPSPFSTLNDNTKCKYTAVISDQGFHYYDSESLSFTEIFQRFDFFYDYTNRSNTSSERLDIFLNNNICQIMYIYPTSIPSERSCRGYGAFLTLQPPHASYISPVAHSIAISDTEMLYILYYPLDNPGSTIPIDINLLLQCDNPITILSTDQELNDEESPSAHDDDDDENDTNQLLLSTDNSNISHIVYHTAQIRLGLPSASETGKNPSINPSISPSTTDSDIDLWQCIVCDAIDLGLIDHDDSNDDGPSIIISENISDIYISLSSNINSQQSYNPYILNTPLYIHIYTINNIIPQLYIQIKLIEPISINIQLPISVHQDLVPGYHIISLLTSPNLLQYLFYLSDSLTLDISVTDNIGKEPLWSQNIILLSQLPLDSIHLVPQPLGQTDDETTHNTPRPSPWGVPSPTEPLQFSSVCRSQPLSVAFHVNNIDLYMKYYHNKLYFLYLPYSLPNDDGSITDDNDDNDNDNGLLSSNHQNIPHHLVTRSKAYKCQPFNIPVQHYYCIDIDIHSILQSYPYPIGLSIYMSPGLHLPITIPNGIGRVGLNLGSAGLITTDIPFDVGPGCVVPSEILSRQSTLCLSVDPNVEGVVVAILEWNQDNIWHHSYVILRTVQLVLGQPILTRFTLGFVIRKATNSIILPSSNEFNFNLLFSVTNNPDTWSLDTAEIDYAAVGHRALAICMTCENPRYICNSVTDLCDLCADGWSGTNCTTCTKCNVDNTQSCPSSPASDNFGRCLCKPGWSGSTCDIESSTLENIMLSTSQTDPHQSVDSEILSRNYTYNLHMEYTLSVPASKIQLSVIINDTDDDDDDDGADNNTMTRDDDDNITMDPSTTPRATINISHLVDVPPQSKIIIPFLLGPPLMSYYNLIPNSSMTWMITITTAATTVYQYPLIINQDIPPLMGDVTRLPADPIDPTAPSPPPSRTPHQVKLSLSWYAPPNTDGTPRSVTISGYTNLELAPLFTVSIIPYLESKLSSTGIITLDLPYLLQYYPLGISDLIFKFTYPTIYESGSGRGRGNVCTSSTLIGPPPLIIPQFVTDINISSRLGSLSTSNTDSTLQPASNIPRSTTVYLHFIPSATGSCLLTAFVTISGSVTRNIIIPCPDIVYGVYTVIPVHISSIFSSILPTIESISFAYSLKQYPTLYNRFFPSLSNIAIGCNDPNCSIPRYQCNHISGLCDQCSPGWDGVECSQCSICISENTLSCNSNDYAPLILSSSSSLLASSPSSSLLASSSSSPLLASSSSSSLLASSSSSPTPLLSSLFGQCICHTLYYGTTCNDIRLRDITLTYAEMPLSYMHTLDELSIELHMPIVGELYELYYGNYTREDASSSSSPSSPSPSTFETISRYNNNNTKYIHGDDIIKPRQFIPLTDIDVAIGPFTPLQLHFKVLDPSLQHIAVVVTGQKLLRQLYTTGTTPTWDNWSTEVVFALADLRPFDTSPLTIYDITIILGPRLSTSTFPSSWVPLAINGTVRDLHIAVIPIPSGQLVQEIIARGGIQGLPSAFVSHMSIPNAISACAVSPCGINQECDHVIGKCICKHGFSGSGCLETVCSSCYGSGNTVSCQRSDPNKADFGKCICSTGYTGTYCHIPIKCESSSRQNCSSHGFHPLDPDGHCSSACACLGTWTGTTCNTCTQKCYRGGEPICFLSQWDLLLNDYKQCSCPSDTYGKYCQCKLHSITVSWTNAELSSLIMPLQPEYRDKPWVIASLATQAIKTYVWDTLGFKLSDYTITPNVGEPNLSLERDEIIGDPVVIYEALYNRFNATVPFAADCHGAAPTTSLSLYNTISEHTIVLSDGFTNVMRERSVLYGQIPRPSLSRNFSLQQDDHSDSDNTTYHHYISIPLYFYFVILSLYSLYVLF